MACLSEAILGNHAQPLVFHPTRSPVACSQRVRPGVRARTPQTKPTTNKVRSIRPKSAGPGKVIGMSVGAKAAGPAKVIGYSVQPATHVEKPQQPTLAEFPMRQLSASSFPMCRLSGYEFFVPQQSGCEFPIRQLSGPEFPMRQLSGSKSHVCQQSGFECPMRQSSYSTRVIVTVQDTGASIVSPWRDSRQIERFAPSTGSPQPDHRQVEAIQPIIVESPARQPSGIVEGAAPSSGPPKLDVHQVETGQPVIVDSLASHLVATEEKTTPAVGSPRLGGRMLETGQPVIVDNLADQSNNKLELYEDDVEGKTKPPAKLIVDDYDDKVKPCVEAGPPEAPMPDPKTYTDPFLKKYFAAVLKRGANVDFVNLGLDFLLGTKEKVDQIKLDDKQWYEHEAQPLLMKSFRLYDTSGTDIVKKDEAARLFASLTSEDSDSAAAFAVIAAEYSIKTQMLMMLSMIPQEFWEGYQEKKTAYEQEMQETVQQAVEATQQDATRRMAIYKMMKDEHDAAALRVMDGNGDGAIPLEAFLAAFNPNSCKHGDLLMALGFITAKEKTQYQQAMRMQTEAPCVQQ